MKTKLLAMILLAGSAAVAGPRVFFGVGFGAPAPVVISRPMPALPPAYVPAARPGYTWIAGYWYPAGPRWAWHAGYWARRPYAGAFWVAPRWNRGHYFAGYWRR